MATKVIRILSGGNKNDDWNYWSVHLNDVNTTIKSSGIPANANISRVGMYVRADYDGGALSTKEIYLRFGFSSSTNSISKFILNDTIVGKDANSLYPSDRGVDVTGYFNKSTLEFSQSNGSYLVFCIHTDNWSVTEQTFSEAFVVIDYTEHTHSWVAATCTNPKTCSSCGATEGSALGHSPGSAATCTTAQTCTRCGVTLANALGHSFGSTTAAKAATCIATGNTAYKKCSRCNKYFASDAATNSTAGKSDTSSFVTAKNPNNHSGGTEVRNATSATCTATGYTGDTYCKGCGAKISSGSTIAKKAHTEIEIPAVVATCLATGLTAGKKCSVCGVVTVAQQTIQKLNHSYTGAIKSDGNGEHATHSFKCVNGCNQYGGAVEHTWNDGVVTQPTATSQGYTTYTCTVSGCGATYTDRYTNLVTFKSDSGTTLKTEIVARGGKPTPPTAPTKADTAQWKYTFDGWYDQNGNKWTSSTTITAATTFTARYTATVQKYTVRWFNYDGTPLEIDTGDTAVPYGTKPDYNGATPTRPSDDYYHYGFAGWSPNTEEIIQGDKDFTAQFAQVDRYYTVRWVNASAVQGTEGALLETDEVLFNTKPDYNGATPKHPKQDTDPALNYDFIGWGAKVTDPAKPDTGLEEVKGDITYTAIYETTPKLYAITVILFDSQSTDVYEYGTEVTIEAPEIVDFHRFIKWSDGDTRRSRPITVTGVTTYQAIYERIPVPVKVNKEQVTGCYIVPTTKTIVYVISGTAPTVETKRESVDGWSFLVSNSVPDNGYPLEKLFITDKSGVTTRVY